MENYIIDVIATFGAVFAYYDSPLFERTRNFLATTKLQTTLLFALFFTFTTAVGFHFFDYLVAVSSVVLFVNAVNTRLRQLRR
jgi:hypothetical protein